MMVDREAREPPSPLPDGDHLPLALAVCPARGPVELRRPAELPGRL